MVVPAFRRTGAFVVGAAALLLGARMLAQQPPATPPVVRTDISGDWAVISNEEGSGKRPPGT